MREIKFRAWHKEQGVMYSCSEINDIYPDVKKITLIEEDFEGDVWTTWKLEEEVELMQFTGLKDKNGVEIYEGDILDFDADEWGDPDFKSVVSWDSKNGEWSWGGGLASDVDQFRQVIGNIYSNPELLGKEE